MKTSHRISPGHVATCRPVVTSRSRIFPSFGTSETETFCTASLQINTVIFRRGLKRFANKILVIS